mgnify:CR=1 FL=1
MIEKAIKSWHQAFINISNDTLENILSDDVIFHSPVVYTPQKGKKITSKYLVSALTVLNNGQFEYCREVLSGKHAVLEFKTEIDGIVINGVDMISINEQGEICDFKVMIRPLQAVNIVHKKVGEMLAKSK